MVLSCWWVSVAWASYDFIDTQRAVEGLSALAAPPCDFDGDGDLELVTFDAATYTFSVWDDSGAGWTRQLEVASGPGEVLTGDFDDDGVCDVISGDQLYSGGLGFVVTHQYGAGLDGVPADVDGDGDLDLLEHDQWWENRTDGTAFLATPLGAVHVPELSPAIGDVDGDGDPDLFGYWASGGKGSRSWWENQGGFTWIEHSVQQGFGSWSFALVDTDGDGDSELLYSLSNGPVTIRENLGGTPTTFGPEIVLATVPGYGGDLYAVADGAGAWLAVTDSDDTTVFGITGVAVTWQGTVGLGTPTWADLEGDGVRDLLLAGGTSVRAWTGFPAPAETVLGASSSWSTSELQPADVDGDGDTDLVQIANASLSWLENADGFGSTWVVHDISTSGTLWYPVADPHPADFDGDGDVDVVLWDSDTDEVALWANDGVGQFTRSILFSQSTVDTFAVGDVDGDGAGDVLTVDGGSAVIHRNLGGLFTPTTLVSGASDVTGVAFRDLDLDGDLDVVVETTAFAYRYDNRNGLGTLWSSVNMGPGDSSTQFWTSDLDLDGDLDLVGGGGIGDVFAVFEQTLPFGQAWGFRSVGGSGTDDLALADIDVDGDDDVVVVDAYAGLDWYRNDWPTAGSASFADEPVVGGPDGQVVAALDVDGDGDPDVVSQDVDAGTLTVFRNKTLRPPDDPDGDGLPDAVDTCPLAADPYPVFSDADGIADVCDCNDADPTVYPGAPEACNGRDENCDDVVDEGFDADLDGYTTCGADGLTGTADDDCDDLDPEVSPGATELCNGIDDDCDGAIDPCVLTLVLPALPPGSRPILTIGGAAAGEKVTLLEAQGTGGAGPCPAALGGLCLGLGPGAKVVGSVNAKGDGTARFEVAIAPGTPVGTQLAFQAVAPRGGVDPVTTEAEVGTVGP